jgi:branched-chain amino acid transport system permease protein
MNQIGIKKLVSIKNLIFLLLGIGFLILPQILKNNYVISTIVYCFSFAAFGVAWNLIGGYGAQISWCHAAFVAVGAYTSFIAYGAFNMSPFLSMPIGMALSYLLATIIGRATFRLRGSYFSIATIAFAEIVRILLLYYKTITGGASGKYITFSKESFLNLTFKKDTPFYYIMLVVLVIVLLITAKFEKSKIGYYLGAIKGDEDAAMSLGIPAFKIKLTAFQLSAVITSAIGTIFAFFLTYIDPTSVGSMTLSVKIGVVAIIGGVGTLWGPVLGAFLIVPLIELTSVLLGQKGGSQLLYGLALVLVVIFRPNGLIGLIKKTGKLAKPDRSSEKGSNV